MKKHLLFIFALFITSFGFSQVVLVEDDFESYQPGDNLAFESEYFTTWSGLDQSEEDPFISDDYAASGFNSVEMAADTASGGPANLLMPLGYESGGLSVDFKIYIPEGYGAYYNMQTDTIAGVGWGWEVLMTPDGEISVDVDGTEQLTASFNHDEWIDLSHDVDLDNDEVEFMLNGSSIGSIEYTEEAGSINLYAYAGGSDLALYYIDDVSISEISTGVEELARPSLSMHPNPAEDEVRINISEAGSNAELSVFDLTGRKVYTQEINSKKPLEIDVSNWQQGIYAVQLENNSHFSTRKLVVK